MRNLLVLDTCILFVGNTTSADTFQVLIQQNMNYKEKWEKYYTDLIAHFELSPTIDYIKFSEKITENMIHALNRP